MTTIKYIAHERHYEIKYWETDEGFFVSTFYDGHRIKTYDATRETINDSKNSAVPITMDSLIEIAKGDLDILLEEALLFHRLHENKTPH